MYWSLFSLKAVSRGKPNHKKIYICSCFRTNSWRKAAITLASMMHCSLWNMHHWSNLFWNRYILISVIHLPAFFWILCVFSLILCVFSLRLHRKCSSDNCVTHSYFHSSGQLKWRPSMRRLLNQCHKVIKKEFINFINRINQSTTKTCH